MFVIIQLGFLWFVSVKFGRKQKRLQDNTMKSSLVPYTQVAPQLSVLRGHPEASPFVQGDKRLGRVPAPILPQKAALEIR